MNRNPPLRVSVLAQPMIRRTNQSGFTLLEIMIVVSIIVILLGLAISKMGNPTAFAKTTAVRADVQSIGTQLMQYEAMNGFYPSTEQGCRRLSPRPRASPDQLGGTSSSKNF